MFKLQLCIVFLDKYNKYRKKNENIDNIRYFRARRSQQLNSQHVEQTASWQVGSNFRLPATPFVDIVNSYQFDDSVLQQIEMQMSLQ